jgi:hypothetical protein
MEESQTKKPPRRPNRTVEEKLADYLKHKAGIAERARKRKQKSIDHQKYLAKKKRKRLAEWEAVKQARLQKKQDRALDRARKREEVQALLEEKRFLGLSRYNKLFTSGYRAAQAVMETEIAALRQRITELEAQITNNKTISLSGRREQNGV